MAKLRLNKEMREALNDFASLHVTSPAFEKAADKAYSIALPLVIAAVRKKYPDADMTILERYELAKPDTCLRGFSDTGQLLEFKCHAEDAPVVPKGYCASRNYSWSAKCVAAIEDYNLKAAQAKEDRERVLRDYRSLIASYQNAEDVVEAWPASSAILQGYFNAASKSLPATLPVEALERIKALNVGALAA